MYLEHSRSQQSVYKGSLLSHSDSFSLNSPRSTFCFLAIFSLAPYTLRVEAAEKQAKRKRKKKERNNKKALQTSQSGKRKASRASASKTKRQKPSGGGAAAAEVQPAAPSKVARSSSAVKLPT
jgi:hypothetical protein